jgi:hypothetical protein
VEAKAGSASADTPAESSPMASRLRMRFDMPELSNQRRPESSRRCYGGAAETPHPEPGFSAQVGGTQTLCAVPASAKVT